MTTPIPPGTVAGIAGLFGKGAKAAVEGIIPGADAANAAIDGIVATRRWLSDRHNWTRVAWTLGGAFLMYMGVLMLAKPQIESAAQAAGKVLDVVPVGKAAKAAKAVAK